jgi:hypothetical protein
MTPLPCYSLDFCPYVAPSRRPRRSRGRPPASNGRPSPPRRSGPGPPARRRGAQPGGGTGNARGPGAPYGPSGRPPRTRPACPRSRAPGSGSLPGGGRGGRDGLHCTIVEPVTWWTAPRPVYKSIPVRLGAALRRIPREYLLRGRADGACRVRLRRPSRRCRHGGPRAARARRPRSWPDRPTC